mmetsp:Transcript_33507/g.107714  ORF Transcript_33507/g.107714 Transcript_33507/m.107714 type:complete len:88 (-) Transcript_33507:310-573(-)
MAAGTRRTRAEVRSASPPAADSPAPAGAGAGAGSVALAQCAVGKKQKALKDATTLSAEQGELLRSVVRSLGRTVVLQAEWFACIAGS